MGDGVLRRDDWLAGARDPDFAEYMRRARERFDRGEAVTVEYVREVYRRAAEELRQEIAGLTPGSLTYSHRRYMADLLDRMARNINTEALNAIRYGIELAVEEATAPAEQITRVVTAGVLSPGEVRQLFGTLNQRAVMAVLSRTYHDGLRLSDRVWRVSQHARQALTRLVEDAVVRGLDARTLAKQVQQYLQPGVHTVLKDEVRRRLRVPRDVSMEAMRLAVTEMQHVYHEGTVQAYRHVPSCRGFYWRLSHAHSVIDICDTYARRNGNGFWDARDVPPKPHPWCRCVLVPAMEEPREFVRRLRAWVNDPNSQPDIERWYNTVRDILGRTTTAIAVSAAASAATSRSSKRDAKLADVIEERITKVGIQSDQDLIEIGEMIQKEIDRRLQNVIKRQERLKAKVRELMLKIAEADRRAALAVSRSEREEWRKKGDELAAELEKVRKQIANIKINRGEMALKVLREIRNFGSKQEHKWTPNTPAEVRQAVKEASKYLPTDWLRRSFERAEEAGFEGIITKRGYYWDRGWTTPSVIALSDRGGERAGMVGCALHELGHRMEYTVPRIVEMERLFYQRRTAGEEPEWLGPGYEEHELTRRDRFVDPYMGKEYGSAYEILTMGLEGLFFGTCDLSKDPEFEAFILGVLATL